MVTPHASVLRSQAGPAPKRPMIGSNISPTPAGPRASAEAPHTVVRFEFESQTAVAISSPQPER